MSTERPQILAVFWDMGGVLTESPFEAFARYEAAHDLPTGFLRGVNATNADRNAWAGLERGDLDLDQFDEAFAAESASAGHRVPGAEVLALLAGAMRPAMLRAVEVCRSRATTALLTNNVAPLDPTDPEVAVVLDLFDVVCQSSVLGVRKPEPDFYRKACDDAGVEPHQVVFLDDLGVNLKPARALGMHTIKVVTPDRALESLAEITGWPVTAAHTKEGTAVDG